MVSGALDDAAKLLDGTLDEAARDPRLLASIDALSGFVRRATIALARGEQTEAR